ncbi:Uma2 family endonuclease [soil metagenome]
MNALPRTEGHLTVEEYLAIEEASDIRHEFVNGEVHALAGASEKHQTIILNIATALRGPARDRGCRVLLDGLKLQVAEKFIYYPDVMVNCDPTDDDPYVKQTASLVVEVLSPTTATTDRREKPLFYLQLPSLLCYMIVFQDEQRVELRWGPDVDSDWHFEVVAHRPVKIPGLDLELRLEEIYEGVEAGPAGSTEWPR